MKALLTLIGLCLLVSSIGCTNQTKTAADKRSGNKQVEPAETEKSPIELKVVNLNDFKEAIKEQKGKVVVIDFWATWCPPCIATFPHHVELQRKFHDKNVVCMSVSMDDMTHKDRAHKFLEQQKATFLNYIPGDDPEKWQEHWDFSAIPATMVYDQGGKLHRFTHTREQSFKPQDVERLVEKLVKN